MNRFFRTVTMTAGVAAMLGSAALNAAMRRSESISIPFDFKVAKTALPAGNYRLEQGVSDAFARLVNVKSGKQVQLLRPFIKAQGKTKLMFEHGTDGYVLKKLG